MLQRTHHTSYLTQNIPVYIFASTPRIIKCHLKVLLMNDYITVDKVQCIGAAQDGSFRQACDDMPDEGFLRDSETLHFVLCGVIILR